MKNFKINPEITVVDCTFKVPATDLVRLGWELDINNPEDYDVNLNFRNDSGKLACLWSFDIDGSDNEDSGDTDKSVEDILHLLNVGLVEYEEKKDWSENKNGGYNSWVIE